MRHMNIVYLVRLENIHLVVLVYHVHLERIAHPLACGPHLYALWVVLVQFLVVPHLMYAHSVLLDPITMV